MIFVTVGTQLAFPRLIDAMEAYAASSGEEIMAQTGPDPARRAHLRTHETLDPAAFETAFTSARVVVAHAGIGSILSAQRYARPLIVMPRRFDHGEHRNDHQLATARQVDGTPGIHVAWDADDLAPLLARSDLEAAGTSESAARQDLIAHLQAFIGGAAA